MHINGCNIVPAMGAHAVRSAMFVLELPVPLSSAVLDQVAKHYESSPGLKDLFPQKTESRGVSIALDQSGVGVQQAGEVVGLVLQRFAADGVPEFVLSLQLNLVSFTCNKYTRWNDMSKEAWALFSTFAQFFTPSPGVAVLGLQYADEFHVTEGVDDFRPSMVFSEHVKRLPASVLDQTDAWHSHSGWFENVQDGKVLNNLNVSYVPQQPQPGKALLQIVGAHRWILPKAITSKAELEQVGFEIFENLHARNKELLSEILNTQAQEDINLAGAKP